MSSLFCCEGVVEISHGTADDVDFLQGPLLQKWGECVDSEDVADDIDPGLEGHVKANSASRKKREDD
jgi:hypothetical protein